MMINKTMMINETLKMKSYMKKNDENENMW